MALGPEALAPDASARRARGAEQSPVDRLVSRIFAEAQRRHATHVHLESCGAGIRVRLRIGGRLADSIHLDTGAELLQSGFDGARFSGRDIVAATLPTRQGPRVVLHLEEPGARGGELAALGMRPALVRALETALARPEGLILAAGPPRSGTSTTMHTLLRQIDAGARCLVEVTDRHQGDVPHVARHVVGSEPGATAAGLRAALLQDADVVMVGSIADRETARLAVEAAQAGRLVIAGVPTAHAVSALGYMRALRIEPFQLASTLRVVIAQRLVQRLCRACRVPVQAKGSVSALLGFDSGVVVYSPGGCEICGGTGFAGTAGVFEAVIADPALRRLINDGGDEAILSRHAFLNAPNLGSAARALVREGITTPEEAMKVSRS